MPLDISAARPDPALLDLPWSVPLADWPEELIAALPRGISRHVVRFAHLSGGIVAVKEIKADIARNEYRLLRQLRRLDLPCVIPLAVVTGRTDDDGQPLDACLVTRHLQFSPPTASSSASTCARTPRSASPTPSPRSSSGCT